MAAYQHDRRRTAPARSRAIEPSPGMDCHWQSMSIPAQPAMAAAAVAGHFVDVRTLS